MKKVNLFESPRFFCDLYCLRPGQEQKVHSHADNDKIFKEFVLDGIYAERGMAGFADLIDEADAFVRKRGKDMSEDSRNALNAFLFRTGTPSTDVMVVFASNLPELFDSAVHDRVDEIVQFPLPALEERRKILQEYSVFIQPLSGRLLIGEL